MSVKRNVIANFAGSLWTALMAVAFVPLYLHYIGAEGFGLVGFFAMAVSLLSIMDAGFGAAAARELARLSALSSKNDASSQDLVRTLEWFFWGIALLLGLLMFLLAPVIAQDWLNVQGLGDQTVTTVIRIMSITLILSWPISFYNGCLIGLQRQVSMNLINIVIATVRGVGAALVLWLVSATVEAFFIWQLVVGGLHVLAVRTALWNVMLTANRKPSFDLSCLQLVGRFALGVGGTNVLALILMQLDKVILSKLLPLDKFGYYTLAWTIVSLILRLTGPVFNAVYPRLTQLVAEQDDARLVSFYRRSCQLMALTMVPVALCLAFYSEELVWLWTQDRQIAAEIRWVVLLLAFGTMLNGLMNVPYGLQLAYGWTSLAFWANSIAICLLIPLTFLLVLEYGLVGGATVWLILNLGYVTFNALIMYRRILPSERNYWYFYAVSLPILLSFIVCSVFQDIIFGSTNNLVIHWSILKIGLSYIFSVLFLGLILPECRSYLNSYLKILSPLRPSD